MRQVVAMDAAAALLLRKWRRQTEWFYNLTFEDLPADKEDERRRLQRWAPFVIWSEGDFSDDDVAAVADWLQS